MEIQEKKPLCVVKRFLCTCCFKHMSRFRVCRSTLESLPAHAERQALASSHGNSPKKNQDKPPLIATCLSTWSTTTTTKSTSLHDELVQPTPILMSPKVKLKFRVISKRDVEPVDKKDPDIEETSSTTTTPSSFLYLIMSNLTRHGAPRVVSFIESDPRIFMRIQMHEGILPGGPKITRHCQYPWQLLVVTGPFNKYASELTLLARKRSRGLESRIRYLVALARRTQKPLYVANDIDWKSILIKKPSKKMKNIPKSKNQHSKKEKVEKPEKKPPS